MYVWEWVNLAEEVSRLDIKSRGWNLFSHNIKTFMSKRCIHVAEMNRMRSGVKTWTLELATAGNGNANRPREKGGFTEL